MGTPLVSIITPCYNQAQYLPEALDSVLRQTYPHWECIIVNDGSKDNTEEVALSYCEKDSRFKYFFKENSGVCDTRNFAVARSQGKYLIPLDADDIIGEGYLKDAVEAFENGGPNLRIVYSQGEYFGALSGPILNKPYDFKTMLVENVFFNSVVFRRSDFDRVGGYHDYMRKGLEDWEILLSMLDESAEVVQLPNVYYRYRILPSSRQRSVNSVMHAELLLNAYEHHKETYDRHFPNPILYVHRWHWATGQVAKLQKELEGIKSSKKYKLAQKLSRIFKH